MATGSSLETIDRANNRRGSSSEHGSEPPNINSNNVEPFVPKRDHDPRDLRSWAKRTGFVSMFSGETAAAGSSRNFENGKGGSDLEKGVGERGSSLSPKIEIDPILGRTKAEIEPSGNGLQGNRNAGELGLRNGNRDEERRFGLNGNATVLGSTDEERNVGLNGNANGNGHGAPEGNVADHKTGEVHGLNEEFHHASFEEEPILGGSRRTFEVKCGVADNPGFGECILNCAYCLRINLHVYELSSVIMLVLLFSISFLQLYLNNLYDKKLSLGKKRLPLGFRLLVIVCP